MKLKMWTYLALALVPLATYFYMARKGQAKSKDCEKGGELVKAAMKKDLSDVNRHQTCGSGPPHPLQCHYRCRPRNPLPLRDPPPLPLRPPR